MAPQATYPLGIGTKNALLVKPYSTPPKASLQPWAHAPAHGFGGLTARMQDGMERQLPCATWGKRAEGQGWQFCSKKTADAVTERSAFSGFVQSAPSFQVFK